MESKPFDLKIALISDRDYNALDSSNVGYGALLKYIIHLTRMKENMLEQKIKKTEPCQLSR